MKLLKKKGVIINLKKKNYYRKLRANEMYWADYVSHPGVMAISMRIGERHQACPLPGGAITKR